MCLRLACRYDTVRQAIVLPSGACLTQHNNISGIGEGDEQQNLATSPVTPLLELATSLSRLQLDNTEVALLAAVLLVRSGKSFCSANKYLRHNTCELHILIYLVIFEINTYI